MNYKRNIVGSEEYKKLINVINGEINEIDEKIIELEGKRKLVEPKITEYRKTIDNLDEKIDSLDDKLYNNFRLNQRIYNALAVLRTGTPLSIFFAFFPFFYQLGNDSAFASQMYMPFETANIVWGTAILGGSVVELLNTRKLGISEKTKKNAMKEKKNIKLKKEIDKYTELVTEIFNDYSDAREELNSINSEIATNTKDKEYLLLKKKKIIELATNYDSINELQRIFGTSMYVNNQNERQNIKVLKRINKY